MTDAVLLRTEIDKSGISIAFISRKIGITRECFYQKLNGKSEFKASEIVALCSILHLSAKKREKIFFAKISDLKSQKLEGEINHERNQNHQQS